LSHGKEQGGQRLILRTRRHVALQRQMRQKRGNLRRPQIARMTLAMKEDEAFNPVDVGRLRAQAVMPGPKVRTHLIQQAGLRAF
jgi:hypothetical protein